MALMKIVFAVAMMLLVGPVQNSEIRVSEKCVGKTLCYDKPDNYDDYMKEMQLSWQKSGPAIMKHEEDDFQEVYEINDENQNCRSLTKIARPYVHMGNDSSDLLVVQLDIFQQRVRTTECFPKSEIISYGDEGECLQTLAQGWKGQCKNKFSKIDLYVYNLKKKQLEIIPTELPVCCYCSISI